MVLCYRVRPERLKCLSNHVKRWYSQTSRITSSGYISADRRTGFPENPGLFIHHRPNANYVTIRSFAAPIQAKPKAEAKDSQGPRLNNAITAPKVRLVVDEGHCIVSRREALERAKYLKLDLVEVQQHADPPVCKIMDFHKEKYKQQLKEKDRSKSKSEATLRKDVKEVRFTGKIEQKDLQMKANMVKRLMERGYRVKCVAMGKEEEDLGGQLSRLSVLIEDVAYVESAPRVERRQAFAVVRHIKYGAPKKNPGKKAIGTIGSTKTVLKSTDTSTITFSKISVKDGVDSNMEDDDLSDQEVVEETQVENDNVDEVMAHSSDTTISLEMEKSKDSEQFFSEQKTWSAFGADSSGDIFDFNDNDKTLSAKEVNLSLLEGTDVTKVLQQKPPVASKVNDEGNRVANYRSVINAQQHVEFREPTFESVLPNIKQTKSVERLTRSVERVNIGAETKLGTGSVSSSFSNLKPPPQEEALKNVDQKQGPNVKQTKSVERLTRSVDRINIRAETKLGTDSVSSSLRNLKPPPQVEAQKNVDPKQGQPLSSYGIFSNPKTARDLRASREANNGRQQNPVNLPSPNLGGPGLNKNLLKPDAENKQQEAEKSKQGGWGVFSTPSEPRSSDSSTKAQR
ncbi:translation initiation factor IF3-1, mitochondrial [Aristolochia californica]|uniref:translation initiation factor IF3-1, mitochondrial n=1 Tax=Aristolochia californica TaxID=171875 RepID=UPI0035E2DFBF